VGLWRNLQPEAIAAILEVMIITDELGRGAVAGADRNRAAPHESDLHARGPGAAIYKVHLQNLRCKLLLERREPVPLGQGLSRDTQIRDGAGGMSISIATHNDGNSESLAPAALCAICKLLGRMLPRRPTGQSVEDRLVRHQYSIERRSYIG
jgi:hypothetical protein